MIGRPPFLSPIFDRQKERQVSSERELQVALIDAAAGRVNSIVISAKIPVTTSVILSGAHNGLLIRGAGADAGIAPSLVGRTLGANFPGILFADLTAEATVSIENVFIDSSAGGFDPGVEVVSALWTVNLSFVKIRTFTKQAFNDQFGTSSMYACDLQASTSLAPNSQVCNGSFTGNKFRNDLTINGDQVTFTGNLVQGNVVLAPGASDNCFTGNTGIWQLDTSLGANSVVTGNNFGGGGGYIPAGTDAAAGNL